MVLFDFVEGCLVELDFVDFDVVDSINTEVELSNLMIELFDFLFNSRSLA